MTFDDHVEEDESFGLRAHPLANVFHVSEQQVVSREHALHFLILSHYIHTIAKLEAVHRHTFDSLQLLDPRVDLWWQ